MQANMLIEILPIQTITPYPDNPRKIPEESVDAVKNSIRKFGFRQPIVVDANNVILAGHTRHKAAQELGLAEVPVHRAIGLTAEQARAYRLADNRSAEHSYWDIPLLTQELQELKTDFEMTEFGFSQAEMELIDIDDKKVMNGEAEEPWEDDPNAFISEKIDLPKASIHFSDDKSIKAFFDWIQTQDATVKTMKKGKSWAIIMPGGEEEYIEDE